MRQFRKKHAVPLTLAGPRSLRTCGGTAMAKTGNEKLQRDVMTDAQPPEIGYLLAKRAADHADKVLFTYLTFDGKEPQRISYGDLYSRACAIAAMLVAGGFRQRPVLLLYPPGPEFAPAFYGALLARAIAVPAPLPLLKGHYQRLDSIALDCTPGAVLSTDAVLARLRALVPSNSPLRACPWLSTDEDYGKVFDAPKLGSSRDIALLQYTSGSTADPRGVMVTHSNLAHNVAMVETAFQLPYGARGVSWLPHFHDMGLISGFVAPLACSGESFLMSPEAFLRRPLRWLEAISHHRGQVCGAPNFAYDLCARSADRAPLPVLDLGSWQTAFLGAEPVRASTMQAFVERFGPAGFRSSALTPCYGMAEATVLVSCTRPLDEPAIHSLSRVALVQGQARPSSDRDALSLVSSGMPAAGTTVRIVDPVSAQPVGSGEIGEIWVSGPQVAPGYWGRQSDDFDAVLAGSSGMAFLRTGDLGFLAEMGELVFVERLKDVIVSYGQKYVCHDLELTAGTSHAALAPGNCLVFSLDDVEKPHIAIIVELPRHAAGQAGDAAQAIRAAWFTTHGLSARTIAFVARGELSRTTSGKLQRRLSARRLMAGAMDVLTVYGDALPDTLSPATGG